MKYLCFVPSHGESFKILFRRKISHHSRTQIHYTDFLQVHYTERHILARFIAASSSRAQISPTVLYCLPYSVRRSPPCRRDDFARRKKREGGEGGKKEETRIVCLAHRGPLIFTSQEAISQRLQKQQRRHERWKERGKASERARRDGGSGKARRAVARDLS